MSHLTFKVLEGGDKRWKRLCKGRSSNQKLELILDDYVQMRFEIFWDKKLSASFRNKNKEWHVGRGQSIRVPMYLRYDGQVILIQLQIL